MKTKLHVSGHAEDGSVSRVQEIFLSEIPLDFDDQILPILRFWKSCVREENYKQTTRVLAEQINSSLTSIEIHPHEQGKTSKLSY